MNDFMDRLINKIIFADCIETMQKFTDKSIDMILCDLPYEVTFCTWDKNISLEKLWNEYNRIIKDNGAILLFGTQPFTSKLINSNEKMFRYEWIWKKTRATGFFHAKKRPMKIHENICVFYKKQPIYNPQLWYSTPYKGYKSKIKKNGESYNFQNSQHRDNPNGERYPQTILEFKQETGLHPTQKPIKLCEFLIKTYTKHNELVLDNCIGSGTTAIACLNTERNFIGIENNKKYIDIAINRIKNYVKQHTFI